MNAKQLIGWQYGSKAAMAYRGMNSWNIMAIDTHARHHLHHLLRHHLLVLSKNVNWTFVRDAAEPETPVLEEMRARTTEGSQQYHVSVSATFCMVIINSTMYR